MWFGTKSGLNRYDGYRFKIFKHDLNNSTSISDDCIMNITTGPSNKLWIQTRSGYNVYDPLTERFSHQIKKELAKIAVPDSAIISLKKDKYGNFWFLHARLGLYKFNPAKRSTIHLQHTATDTSSLYAGLASSLTEDKNGNIWLIYKNGVIEKVDHLSNRITKRIYKVIKLATPEFADYQLFVDNQDDLWVFTPTQTTAVVYLNLATNQYKLLAKDATVNKISSDIVYSIVQDKKGLIWIATDHGGINLLDKTNFKIQYLKKRPDNDNSLSQDCIISMYKDDTDIIWLGTFKKGISYYHDNIIKFPLYKQQSSAAGGLSYNDSNEFLEDAKGNIWIGSNGGGLIYFNRTTGKFTTYLHSPANANSLCNNIIASLCLDHEQKLWIGTYFGGLDCFDGKNFIHYRHNSSDKRSIADNSVWDIKEDSKRRLWIGTLSGGLDLFDRDKKVFKHFKSGQANAIRDIYISGILEDSKGNIWLSGNKGVDIIQPNSSKIIHYVHQETDKNSLINNNVSNMIEDSRKLIWLATNEGLSMFNPVTQKFINFKQEDGLPTSAVLSVLEDKNHTIWLSTTNGLSNLILTQQNGKYKYQFKNYDQTDGLQGKLFNEDAACATRKGELIFGGADGFNLFKPENIIPDRSKPVLVLTSFQLFTKSLRTGEEVDGHEILSKSITETKNITLKHNENVFSIEFAAISFFNPSKIKQSYMLDGFDKGWITDDNNVKKVSYTNLDPGKYVFRLKATDGDGNWNKEQLTLNIQVLPPIWETTWAYLLYSLMIAGGLLYIRYRGIKKLKNNFKIEQERQEAKRMHEVDLMKIKFFTNVSHEFRTPLALILAPTDKLLKQLEHTEQHKQLQLVNRNARRLLNMVNQLLDFRKMETHELKLNTRNGDIIRFIKDAVYSFSDVAEKKNINLSFSSTINLLLTDFDHDKIERIIFNLLSNAFKFTEDLGKVTVQLSLNTETDKDNQQLVIKVADTGIGIPEEKQLKIFDRFFQNHIPGSMVNQGSGIGLSIVKEFIKLHNGEIFVENNTDKGSIFTVLLPVKINKELQDFNITLFSNAEIQEQTIAESGWKEQAANPVKTSIKKATILLVEDNDDFRFYLKDNLKEYFNVIEAVNGREGWQKALATHPNLVVSDISMPEMNGINLSEKIKHDARTSHIPVILLTAVLGEDELIKALEAGVNDYLTKPFNFEILLSKIKNLLAEQNLLKKTYQKQVTVNPTDYVLASHDDIFMKEMLKIVENKMVDPNFSVEELSSDLAMSRATLYRKVLLLTGTTPVEFIKLMRLKRSAQLLKKNQMNIAEVAYQVGFNNPKYFSKLFKIEYNMLPTEYKNFVSQQEVS
jgi:signal transduction histidine kinase/ligand-binding sensor domain-containing protein/DNA-binding response OmpR family regulator